MGENQESVEAFAYNDRIMESLKVHAPYILAIHITDQRLYNKFDLVMKVHLRVDPRTIRHDKG